MDGVGRIAKVLHQHNDLAAITRVDNSGIAEQALLRQSGAGLHDSSGRGHEFDGDSGVNSGRAVRGNSQLFGRVQVVADIFSWMSDCGQDGVG